MIYPATPSSIADAAAALCAGRLVAFPTETVYGLGADAGNEKAVAAVFAAKGRPRFNPLIVHVPDLTAARALALIDTRAERLAAAFWPGPLTLVLPRRPDARLSLLVSAGLDTVAVRVPDHGVAAALLRSAQVPIAAPSANPSGAISPTTAKHVAAGLGEAVEIILDGGPCRVGLESTIIDLTSSTPAILRPGAITADAIAALVGPIEDEAAGPPVTATIKAPGMLRRHYAPSRPLRLGARSAGPGEALLAFGPAAPEGTASNFSPSGDLTEAAANLFAMLRALDRPDVAAIAVMPIPDVGLGLAINDRLKRAAAPAEAPYAEAPKGRDANDWNDERGPSAPCVLPDA